MPDKIKSEKILDALQQLLEEKSIQHISVSEIAAKAGIGKGSIYYYFPSKDAIVDALIERSYEMPLDTAKNLSTQTGVSSLTRMAMMFQACRNSSAAFLKQDHASTASVQDLAFLHQKYLNYLISELKPALTDIISQGIACGEICFDHPAALAEIALIVLAVKAPGCPPEPWNISPYSNSYTMSSRRKRLALPSTARINSNAIRKKLITDGQPEFPVRPLTNK